MRRREIEYCLRRARGIVLPPPRQQNSQHAIATRNSFLNSFPVIGQPCHDIKTFMFRTPLGDAQLQEVILISKMQ